MHRLAILASACAALPLPAQQLGLKLTHGTDGYLEVAANPRLVPPSGLTVEAWLTYDDATLQPGWAWPTVVRQNIAPTQESWFLRVDAGQTAIRQLRFKVTTANGGQVSAAWTFQAGQLLNWTHVAGTWDGTTAKLYVNGAVVGQGTGSGPIRDLGGVLRIGKGDDALGGGEVWNGEIDEVRIWPFARTDAEIAGSMRQEIGRVPAGAMTWPLNGHPLDTSTGTLATVNGAAQFVPNPLNLTWRTPSGAAAVGAGTACRGAEATIGSVPIVGNADFAFVGTRGPAQGAGAAFLSTGTLGAPLPILGLDLWLDPAGFVTAFPAASDALGVSRLPLGIPNDPTLANLALATQLVFVDACGSQGFSAASAVRIAIQL